MKAAAPPPFDKLYWLRLGLGVVAGFLANELAGTSAANGVSLGILVYLISYYLARYTWYKGVDKQFAGKVYTTGLGGFFGLFLFTWIILFTLTSA